MYKLLIADDESIIRKGIKNLIDFESLEIDQVFEAENGKEAVDLALKKQDRYSYNGYKYAYN